jgi:hypothetical protein
MVGIGISPTVTVKTHLGALRISKFVRLLLTEAVDPAALKPPVQKEQHEQ